MTIYEQVGGADTIRQIVEAFYRRVEADPVLRPLFPPDLEPGKHSQYLFLVQYFGGPGTYSEQRGHPRLRMRHNQVSIGQQERDHWLEHMLAALDEVGVAEPARTEMREYFHRASTFMINHMDAGHPSLRIVGNGQAG